jgi:hypothetical protein
LTADIAVNAARRCDQAEGAALTVDNAVNAASGGDDASRAALTRANAGRPPGSALRTGIDGRYVAVTPVTRRINMAAWR